MELIKTCLFIFSIILFAQSIHAIRPINHLVFSDKTSVVTYPCHNDKINSTDVKNICLYTCIRGDCSEDKYKVFSIVPKEVKNIHYYSSTIANNKLLFAMVSNLTDSVHILKCGHASCTSFRSSYKPIVDNSKSNIGYGVSINLQSNGNPVLSFFSKGDDVIYLTRVDCDDEFCDKYSIYHSSERKDYHSQSLSTQILFGSNNEPIIVANDGYKISSFRKVDEQFEETILFELSEVESLSFKNASNNEYLVTYVVDNHPHVGKCDINLTKCRSFTPAFLPGELGVADGVSKSDSLYSVVFASVMELDKIKSSIQFASCKGTTCDVVHDVFTETHNETLEIGVSLFRNESSFPIIRYQYGASPLTLIDCLDESCSKFNVSSIDPSKTVASRYQKRINIVWAIIILPALCLAVAIILAIWRIQRYIKDKRESYQPIS